MVGKQRKRDLVSPLF